ncbi:CU044_5270 family protein [Amycolatopsis magusensis]|uniref:CU044_5270 family protein n=1 Tax=Amycolatopsis magusensis TaxID=882444 RepID=A0ABS4PW56_9PSEU|nr:CU044_5270 family protein [Amycolatopsis magusensis]MBP2183667.1 hypothetical protein [Amycolatopsis magusensis]
MTDPAEHRAVDTALRRYHRAGPRPAPADLALIRQRVLLRTADPGTRGVPGWSLRRVAVAAAASAVVAGVAATAVAVWPSGSPSGTVAGAPPGTGTAATGRSGANATDDAITEAITGADSAPATVDLVVRRVANAQPLDLRHGGYLYTARHDVSVQSATGVDGSAHYVTEEVSERWSAVDAGTLPELIKSTRGLNARPLTPEDGARLAAYGTDYTTVITSTYDPATDPKGDPGPAPEPSLVNPTPAYLASLPTDPERLRAVLRAEAAGDGAAADADHLIFKRVSALATAADALLSPELRSALYRVLAGLPGIERVPGRVDLSGRVGVAIAETDRHGRRTEIVIDPVSTRMIGFRTVALTGIDGIPAGTVLFSATSDQKVVAHQGDK